MQIARLSFKWEDSFLFIGFLTRFNFFFKFNVFFLILFPFNNSTK